jgi:hypothetical protein
MWVSQYLQGKIFYLLLSRLYSTTLNIQACNTAVCFFMDVNIGLPVSTKVTSIGHI